MFFVVKIKSDGSAYTWGKYSNLLQNNDFLVTQDCVYMTYTSNSYNSVYSNNSRTITVPAGLTGVDVFDANGNFITYYSVPSDIPSDFTNKTKDTYYTPLFDSSYFSNASNYNCTKLYKNFWGVFVDGTPSTCSLTTDSALSDVVFTAQYGPASSSVSSLVLPSVNSYATFITKINSCTGTPKWVSYIDNTVSKYNNYTVNISTNGNVYAAGTYGTYQSNIYNSDGTKFAGVLPSLSEDGVYLVKYDSNGYVLSLIHI